MLELIEDFGHRTSDLCVHCRGLTPARFSFMHEIVYQEATAKRPRLFYRVCPHCDVAPITKSLEGE